MPSGRRRGDVSYSDASMMQTLKRAAGTVGRTMSAEAYDRWARAAEGAPSARAVIIRFGSWNAALGAAGLPTSEASRTYEPQWSEAACLESVREWLLSRPAAVTAKAYAEWAMGHSDRASLATVRNRLGSWNTALASAREDRRH